MINSSSDRRIRTNISTMKERSGNVPHHLFTNRLGLTNRITNSDHRNGARSSRNELSVLHIDRTQKDRRIRWQIRRQTNFIAFARGVGIAVGNNIFAYAGLRGKLNINFVESPGRDSAADLQEIRLQQCEQIE